MANLDFLLKTVGLNDITRTGWEIRGVPDPQKVAGHVWSVMWLTFLYADQEPDVDDCKALKLALVHDLAEVKTGDLVVEDSFATMSAEEKGRIEREAIEELLSIAEDSIIQPDTIINLWQEYEERSSSEAIFVKDMDLIEVCLHALLYEKQNRYDPYAGPDNERNNLDTFFKTAKDKIKTKTGENLLVEIRSAYESEK